MECGARDAQVVRSRQMKALRAVLLAIVLAACLWFALLACVLGLCRSAWGSGFSCAAEFVQASYDAGYAAGYAAGMNTKGTKAYYDGVIEGAIQMLCIYDAEGGEAMRRQVRILQGKEPVK